MRRKRAAPFRKEERRRERRNRLQYPIGVKEGPKALKGSVSS